MDSYKDTVMALSKVVAAMAWVDHDIDAFEIESLKDVIFQLNTNLAIGTGLSGRERDQVNLYIESPVDEEERARLVRELQESIRTADQKEMVLQALEDVVVADGELTEDEQVALEEIKASIEQVGTGLGRMPWLVRSSLSRRSKQAAATERLGETVIRAEGELDLPEDEFRRLVLAAGLMAHVAYVDRELLADEASLMREALETYWSITPEAAEYVAQVALSEGAANTDYVRMVRGFLEVTDEESRALFLQVLFAVAHADGTISDDEEAGIEQIADDLAVLKKDFLHAKSQYRESLG